MVQRWLVRAAEAGAAEHVWSYDFVSTQTNNGRSVSLLNLIYEHTRESLLVRADAAGQAPGSSLRWPM